MEVINAIGRRKSAVARVYLSEGTGKITINKKDIETYFPSAILRYVVKQPLQLLEAEGKYDIKANLDGGGFTGQSQALRLAIARALVKVNAEDKKTLKVQGFLTRDAREVERKKPGQPKCTPSLPVQQALISNSLGVFLCCCLMRRLRMLRTTFSIQTRETEHSLLVGWFNSTQRKVNNFNKQRKCQELILTSC